MPQLRGAAYGRKFSLAGRLRYSRINRCGNGCSVFHSSPHAAHTLSLRQPSVDHRPGAGDRLPRHLHASDQESRLFEKDSPHWRGHVDSAIWSVRRLYALWVPGALNLNIHFHMLFLDGVYVDRHDGSTRFRWVSSPTTQELTQLAQTIARRIGRYLECQGYRVLILPRLVVNRFFSLMNTEHGC